MQDGYGDQSDTAVTPILVVRGLEPNVNESVLAKGIQKLFKSASNPTSGVPKNATTKLTSTTNPANLGAKDGSLHRVLLIRDKKSDTSWRFGFAEFFSIQVR
jgi:RNA-binding protein 5/10